MAENASKFSVKIKVTFGIKLLKIINKAERKKRTTKIPQIS